jgi:hypothetical protein
MNPNYFRSAVIILSNGFDFSVCLELSWDASFDEASIEVSSNDASTAISFDLASETSFNHSKVASRNYR